MEAAPSSTESTGTEAAHAGHVMSIGALVGTWLALLTLTAITVAVSRINLGQGNVVVALAVACTKAALVALFFMHLKYGDRFQRVVLAAALFFAIFLCAFVLFDTRQYQGDIRAKANATKVVGPGPAAPK